MLDRYAFTKDLGELRLENDPCKIEYYLNKRFMDLKDGVEDCAACCCGTFQGGSITAEVEAMLEQDKENQRKADIVFVLEELERFYAVQKPELVAAVRSVKAQFQR